MDSLMETTTEETEILDEAKKAPSDNDADDKPGFKGNPNADDHDADDKPVKKSADMSDDTSDEEKVNETEYNDQTPLTETFEEEISFTEDIIVTEVSDTGHTGHTWDVVLIKSGTSKNFNHYPTHVIKSAAD